MRDVARALALVLLGLLLLGFGLCGAAGTVIGVVTLFSSSSDGSAFLGPGIVGLLIAFGAWKGIAALLRKPRPGP